MDNNQNNNYSGQPADNQQSVFNQPQQPQQSVFNQQQPQQQGNPFGNQFAPKKPADFGFIAAILSAVSLLMAVIGSIFVCTCSASKSYDMSLSRILSSGNLYSTSGVVAVNIVAALIAAAAVVLSVVALKKNAESKVAKVAAVLGVFALFYAILPMLTVCGYNCSMNNAYEDAIGSLF